MIRYILKSKVLFGANVLIVLIDSFLCTSFAFVIKNLIDISTTKRLNEFPRAILFSFIYIIFIVLTGYFKSIFLAKYIKDNTANLRDDLFNKLLLKNKQDFSSENTGNYISIINNDVDILQRCYFSNIIFILQALFSFVIASFGLFKLNIYIAISILSLSLIPVAVPYLFTKKLSSLKKSYSDSLSSFIKAAKDYLSGFEVIKSYNSQKRIFSKFSKINNFVEMSRYKVSKNNADMNLIVELFSYAAHFSALGIGTLLLINDKTTVGTFVAAIQLMEFINAPVKNISYIIGSLRSAKLIIKKVIGILDEKTTGDMGLLKNSFDDSIEFKEVSFLYGGKKEALKNISFKINKGEKLLIVGKSGSGKSTLLKLLLRYYDDFDGDILIDGLSIKDISSSSLYRLISTMQQDIFIFDSSIRDNITLFEDYPNDDFDRAVFKSGLSEFINSLESKENSNIGENGCNVSGGEKQRISMARSLIRNTPILVLDEATASLDNDTSLKIENTLLSIPNITLIIVSHRFSEPLLKGCDKIIVLDNGEIAESGKFSDLMSLQGYFYDLYTPNNM